MTWNTYTWIFLLFFALHLIVEVWLELLQDNHLKKRKDKVPSHLKGKVDIETIRKAVHYNRDKLRFRLIIRLIDVIPVWLMIALGFSWLDTLVASFGLGPLATGLLFMGILALAGGIMGLPSELYFTFVIEQKYGFNKQTLGGFFKDKLKNVLIGALLGGGLLACVLWIMDETGEYWWLWAFLAVAIVQLLMMWLYPLVIMPLFNKFEPVEGELAERVGMLASAVGFPLRGVVSMDGSKRSAHSNAFIIGFKGARRIVLYDTLIQKITIPQLIGVLAHELGHFRLGHIKRRLGIMLLMMLGVFVLLGWMVEQPQMYNGLGFDRVSMYGALIVFGLFFQEVSFPFGFLSRLWSRIDEYAADRFAVDAVKNSDDLCDALIGLTKQNLSSPGSHPLYRKYYNSHPALRERLKAIKAYASAKGYLSNLGEVDTAVLDKGNDGKCDGNGSGSGNESLTDVHSVE